MNIYLLAVFQENKVPFCITAILFWVLTVSFLLRENKVRNMTNAIKILMFNVSFSVGNWTFFFRSYCCVWYKFSLVQIIVNSANTHTFIFTSHDWMSDEATPTLQFQFQIPYRWATEPIKVSEKHFWIIIIIIFLKFHFVDTTFSNCKAYIALSG